MPNDNQTTSESPSCGAACSARLSIDQGMIRMADPIAAPSGDYLRKWQMEKGHADGTRIRILTQEHFDDLVSRAQMPSIG
jgi:hypothetical protein